MQSRGAAATAPVPIANSLTIIGFVKMCIRDSKDLDRLSDRMLSTIGRELKQREHKLLRSRNRHKRHFRPPSSDILSATSWSSWGPGFARLG